MTRLPSFLIRQVSIVQRDVSAFQRQCEAELYAAEPAIKKAEAALGGLTKNDLTELKGLAHPRVQNARLGCGTAR